MKDRGLVQPCLGVERNGSVPGFSLVRTADDKGAAPFASRVRSVRDDRIGGHSNRAIGARLNPAEWNQASAFRAAFGKGSAVDGPLAAGVAGSADPGAED